ncbi:uncharacterized protein LOC110093853 isoform X2 [Dendrobium catenatum]|uniref:uncharacterized protein LOC110093853 isoform X2 n=1 Tax=Dendrobium catenatum TaxID=906689 RepID=UPI00109F8D72|nr:uncharacterized protein LOC110093853 isoform X2 [Dendrobium catenatum]
MAVFRSEVIVTLALNPLATNFRKPYFSPLKPRAAIQQLKPASGDGHKAQNSKSAAISDSLKLLEWDAVCDLVSSFAGTQLGRETVKGQLWSVAELSYEETKMRLEETSAAIEFINYCSGGMDFAGIDVLLVKSAIGQASKGFSISGLEAKAVACLIEFAENLQSTFEGAVKEDADWYNRFMPLAEVMMNVSICHSLVASVKKIIDEDGYVKDSASSELKRYRDQVLMVERKLYLLMDKLARNNRNESSSLEVCNVDGRWCIKYMSNKLENFDGLLLSSSGSDYLVEPIAAVELNDELQQARALAAKVEEDVLSQLTDKMLAQLGSIQNLLDTMIQLDAVAARAKYSIEYGATYPNIFLPCEMIRSLTVDGDSCLNGTSSKSSFFHHQREWKLYLQKAYHPLLLKQYRENLENARKALANAASDLRRKKMQGKSMATDDSDSHFDSMKLSILQMERRPPIPVDFSISAKATVLVITGPNTGGKTVSLKTVGLASLMSKAVYADIGDEQSLTQSLSTFSGHLKQISVGVLSIMYCVAWNFTSLPSASNPNIMAIRSNSTSNSLVLLDEVGAGTNPLEGAALGMSLLESFAESGSFLTIATTHHGELKTLKYSNHVFENACVEFDEESLQPTYRILWGIPGRSNAINIAEKLGLPYRILSTARKLHGKTSAEINEIIIDMESSKQDFEQHLKDAQHYLMSSRRLHQDLLMARERVTKHIDTQRKSKAHSISEFAVMARSILHTKLQQYRQSALAQRTSQSSTVDNSEYKKQNLKLMASSNRSVDQTKSSVIGKTSHDKLVRIPEVGETIVVPSLGKEAVVLQVLASKGEIIVQARNIKLRLKLKDVVASE